MWTVIVTKYLVEIKFGEQVNMDGAHLIRMIGGPPPLKFLYSLINSMRCCMIQYKYCNMSHPVKSKLIRMLDLFALMGKKNCKVNKETNIGRLWSELIIYSWIKKMEVRLPKWTHKKRGNQSLIVNLVKVGQSSNKSLVFTHYLLH